MRFEQVESEGKQCEVHLTSSNPEKKEFRFHFGDSALVILDDFQKVISDFSNGFDEYHKDLGENELDEVA